MNELLEKCLVPIFSPKNLRACEPCDFQEFSTTLTQNLQNVIFELDNLSRNQNLRSSEKKNLYKVIIIIGEHCCESAWNNNDQVEIVNNVLIPKICEIYNCNEISEILSNEEIICSIVKFLRPKLLKSSWKSFPAAIACYKWILNNMERSLVIQYVHHLMPTTLIILDDYDEENKTIGLKCLNTIIDHCFKSNSFKNSNYDKVIFQLLEKITHKVEDNLILPIYNCISKLLKIQYSCHDINNFFDWTDQDNFLSILLNNMEIEINSNRRCAYIISLSKILVFNNFGKWSNRISYILCEYCHDTEDFQVLNTTLDFIINFTIYQSKQRNFYVMMYIALLKVFYNIISNKKCTKEKKDKIEKCLCMLNEVTPNIKKELLNNETVKSFFN